MATLDELLASNDPNDLKNLLKSSQGSASVDAQQDFKQNVLPSIKSDQPASTQDLAKERYNQAYNDNYERLKQGNVNLPDSIIQNMAIAPAEQMQQKDANLAVSEMSKKLTDSTSQDAVNARLSALGIKPSAPMATPARDTSSVKALSSSMDSPQADANITDGSELPVAKTKHSETTTIKTKRHADQSSDDSNDSDDDSTTLPIEPGFSNNNVANLKSVQDETNKQKQLLQLQKDAALISSGALGLANNTASPDITGVNKNLDEKMKTADEKVKQFQDLTEKEKDDPNSTYSVGMREFAKPLFDKLNIDTPPNLSATILASVYPNLVKMYDAKQTDETNRLKASEISETRRFHDETLRQDRQDKATKKGTDTENKAYTEMRARVESFRGNKGVQQASGDVLSASKALALVQGKDPNTLTTQDLSLLAGEMSKIATGGVPTEHGVQQLMPSNLQTKFAEMKNFVLSKPTNANAAAYIKKNMSYLSEMSNVASSSINKYQANIARGYMGRINPDQKSEFLSDYPQLSPLFSRGTNVPASESSTQDPKIAQYAKDHSLDYSSAEALIKKRMQGQ